MRCCVPLPSKNLRHWCRVDGTTRYLWIHGLPKRAEYEVFASMTKNRTLKLNVDIWIFTVMAPKVGFPWLSKPQIITSVGSRSSTV